MKKALVCLVLLISQSSFAEYQWGFGNIGINHLDWDEYTQNKSTKTDFNYLELEGGAQYNWGDLYGFYDLENIDKRSFQADEIRTASKASINYYLADTKFGIYAHVYNFTALGFAEQNRVVGLGYSFLGEGWWFKPFLGFHDVTQTFYNGLNGYMGGWVLGYNFKVLTQSFLFASWHEYEFQRDLIYAASNGNNREGQNGAVSLWWMACPKLTLGLQWRYAKDKLGTATGMGAAISSLKYNF